VELTVKHYFNGAAVYANGSICASWSPVGLAFKLPADEADELIAGGQAKPLKYFAKRPIKKGYVLFDSPESKRQSVLRGYFLKAARLAPATRTEKRD
jgi:TfoX/Sxy family transcriptional regulator of competence genes